MRMGDKTSEENQRSLAAPFIFFVVLAFHFASQRINQSKKSGSDKEKEAELHREIKELLKEASALAQPSTFAQGAKLKRKAAAKEKELAKFDIQLSTSYHPQTDGQTEVVNRCLETYLRCMCVDSPHKWVQWLPLAEWWYNTTFHTAIKATPYEIVYGQPPPIHLPYLPGESSIELVDRSLIKREQMLKVIKFHLKRAQERMKQLADKHRSERSFEIGDMVYVKLQAYRQVSVSFKPNAKLSPKYFGPYKVLDKVGEVAYKLELPVNSKIHNVFHVSQLKKHVGDMVVSTTLPYQSGEPLQPKEPEAIIDRMTVKRRGRAVTKVLVKWKHQLPEDATWEFYYDLKKKYPLFHS